MSYKAPYTGRSYCGPVIQRPSAPGRIQPESGVSPWEPPSRPQGAQGSVRCFPSGPPEVTTLLIARPSSLQVLIKETYL